MKHTTKLTLSLALAAALGLGFSGCSGDGGGGSSATSTATDITVERGKVFDATVRDSSSPVQTATQKVTTNVYSFVSAPTYPVLVTGGWIDVNANGVKDIGDVNLSITMKSYSNVVTPVSTYIADANATIREQKLTALKERLNANGVGAATELSEADLLEVPSKANLDVIVLSNAIYKDALEKGGNLGSSDDDSIMSQFGTVAGLTTGATAKEVEEAVVENLVGAGFVDHISESEIPQDNPGGEATDLSSYDVIYIYKNAVSSDGIINQEEINFAYMNSTASSSCTQYGFSNPSSNSTGGITTLTYHNAEQTKLCTEIDYTGSVYSGNVNITSYWNLTESGGENTGGETTETNTTTGGGTTTSGDDTLLSTAAILYIRNNATSVANPTQLQVYNAANNLHCTDYGFSYMYEDTTDFDGNPKKSYLSGERLCNEIDYQSGSISYALYN